jgi:hypothetical protein
MVVYSRNLAYHSVFVLGLLLVHKYAFKAGIPSNVLYVFNKVKTGVETDFSRLSVWPNGGVHCKLLCRMFVSNRVGRLSHGSSVGPGRLGQ